MQSKSNVKWRVQWAISGSSYFLKKCKNDLFLTRNGDFVLALDKTLMSKDGCFLLDRDGENFKYDSIFLSDEGCSSKQCLALIEPSVETIKITNENKIKFTGEIASSLASKPFVMKNSLEVLKLGIERSDPDSRDLISDTYNVFSADECAK